MKNKKHNYIIKIGLIVLIGIIFTQSNIMSLITIDFQPNNNIKQDFLNKPLSATFSSRISIDGNNELELFIQNKGLAGEGTFISPYIIENYTIYAHYGDGIEIINTDAHLIIQNCTIFGGFPYGNDGIYLQRSSNITITNNTIKDNRWGIFLRYSPNNIITNNFVNNTDTFAITLDSESDNCSILNNSVSHSDWGISITDSDNNIISGNDLTYNGDAVYVNNHCKNCTISGNNIALNRGEGVILFSDCTENTIFGNIICHNGGIGIDIWDDCNFNLFYFNDVYENEDGQAKERYDSIGNQWDNGTVGNYWGDYSDKYPDARNNSVFWKTPYEIDGNDLGVDHFPLVNSIVKYKPLEGIKIPGFPLVNILFFISAGVFLLKRKISR